VTRSTLYAHIQASLELCKGEHLLDSGDVTSSAIVVIFGNFDRFSRFDNLRAVAKTWRPRAWKARARPSPALPAVQPVTRTDSGIFEELFVCSCFGGGSEKVKNERWIDFEEK